MNQDTKANTATLDYTVKVHFGTPFDKFREDLAKIAFEHALKDSPRWLDSSPEAVAQKVKDYVVQVEKALDLHAKLMTPQSGGYASGGIVRPPEVAPRAVRSNKDPRVCTPGERQLLNLLIDAFQPGRIVYPDRICERVRLQLLDMEAESRAEAAR